jgi:hypothetical protein
MNKYLLFAHKNIKLCALLFLMCVAILTQHTPVSYAQINTGTGGGQQGVDTGTGSDITLDFQLNNPLGGSGVNTINDFVKRLLDIVLTIGVPVVAVFIILAGFKFVTARGNPKKIEDAKDNLLGVMIGAAILLGAWVLANALGETVNELVAP